MDIAFLSLCDTDMLSKGSIYLWWIFPMTTYCKKHRYATNGRPAQLVPGPSNWRALVATIKETAHMWFCCSAERLGTQYSINGWLPPMQSNSIFHNQGFHGQYIKGKKMLSFNKRHNLPLFCLSIHQNDINKPGFFFPWAHCSNNILPHLLKNYFMGPHVQFNLGF